MTAIPINPSDPVNTAILSVAEDCIEGFHRYPFDVIAQRCGFNVQTVLARLEAMMHAGVIRRIRQTLLATKLAQGALVAWNIPEEKLLPAFDWLRDNDPFTGHVVLRTTDPTNPGHEYKLWTTLKVPSGSNTLDAHCSLLAKIIGAKDFILLPAKGVFSLGVGHMRRRGLTPGDKLPHPASMSTTIAAVLSEEEWKVLLVLKEQLSSEEMARDPWAQRAAALDMDIADFCAVAEELDRKKVIGRFATFLEHVQTKATEGPVTRFNGLFHWTVPEGMEQPAGSECGRHICMTHCYWRTGGTAFGNSQIMGVVHGLEKDAVLAHKAAIDKHLLDCGIPILHTAVFWGLRSEIKPSEISPSVYSQWLKSIKDPVNKFQVVKKDLPR